MAQAEHLLGLLGVADEDEAFVAVEAIMSTTAGGARRPSTTMGNNVHEAVLALVADGEVRRCLIQASLRRQRAAA